MKFARHSFLLLSLAIAVCSIQAAQAAAPHTAPRMQRLAVPGGFIEYETRGRGEAVLLIHGTGVAATFYGVMRDPELAGFRTIRLHRRGFAGSSRTPIPFSIRDHASDAYALLQHLKVRRAHVVGHSVGGMVSMQLTLDHPEVVQSLTVMEPPIFDVNAPPAAFRQLSDTWRSGDRTGAMNTFSTMSYGQDWRALAARVPGGEAQVMADVDTVYETEVPAMTSWVFGATEASRITSPMQYLTGGGPHGASLAQLRGWKPDMESHVIPGVTHAMLMQDPHAVARAVASFLRRHPIGARAATAQTGATLFATQCAVCHAAVENPRAPSLAMLRGLAPSAVVASLASGKMVQQGENLSAGERVAVAEYVTGRTLQAAVPLREFRCTVHPPVAESMARPGWNGWSAGDRNARFQDAANAGISASDVPRLKLAWAFGLPDALAARAQPTVIGDWLFTGSDNGEVYALDSRSGCLHWRFKADGSVRTAMKVAAASASRLALYFGDGRAQAYALDAQTGELIWKRRIEDHANASITGAAAVHEGRVYFAVSAAGEEVRGGNLDYACCTFRGSVSALDLATGSVLWKTYTIATPPQPKQLNPRGVQQYGPAGGGVWGAPAIDARRGVLYVGTGNGFAQPAQPTTNSILAIDLATGAVRWTFQATPADVWLWQCEEGPTRTANCPTPQGPDFDFGSAPLIATTPSGRDLLIVPQKSGVLHALDPDRNGAPVWQYRLGAGSALGGQWGAAADSERVYSGSAETLGSVPGGMHAVSLESGQRAWFSPPQAKLCAAEPGPNCYSAQGGAVTAMPGVVFSGGSDGGLRAYDSREGRILWQYDTNRYFDTVNGVIARGATMDAAGPVVAGGMLYANSGYNGIVGRAGNVLLAFSPEPAEAPSARVAPPTSQFERMWHFGRVMGSVERGIAFYRDALGLELRGDAAALNYIRVPAINEFVNVPAGAELRAALLPIPGISPQLQEPDRIYLEILDFRSVPRAHELPALDRPGASSLRFVVRDLEAALRRMRAAGATTIGGFNPTIVPAPAGYSGNARALMISDPDGYPVELMAIDGQVSSETSGIVDAQMTLVVSDIERSLGVYRILAGEGVQITGPGPWQSDGRLHALRGTRGGDWRNASLRLPGCTCTLELLEFRGTKPSPWSVRFQDIGPAHVAFRARDMDQVLSRMRQAGLVTLSPTGTFTQFNPNLKAVYTRDPDGHFIEIIEQRP